MRHKPLARRLAASDTISYPDFIVELFVLLEDISLTSPSASLLIGENEQAWNPIYKKYFCLKRVTEKVVEFIEIVSINKSVEF